jgi:recombinational DNA repair protein (RecF pathway)
VYRFKAIILNVKKIRDNNTRIVMISSEYWKITGWWNKKNITGIDIWDIVEVLISREGNKNTVKSMDLFISWWNKNWDYATIILFLETLSLINKITIDGNDYSSLFEDTSLFIKYGNLKNVQIYHYSIFQMRILKGFGTMDPEILWDDLVLRYIYQHISHTPLERILSSVNIKNEHIAQIQKINLHSIYKLEQ